MIEDRMQKTESAVKNATAIPEDQKAEIINSLARMKSALNEVSETHPEDAQSIARFAEASAHEATRAEKKPSLLGAALDGLKKSVQAFEATHPALVAEVNEFATALANMGL
jgi:prefoldin subunit 5